MRLAPSDTLPARTVVIVWPFGMAEQIGLDAGKRLGHGDQTARLHGVRRNRQTEQTDLGPPVDVEEKVDR